MASKSRLSLSRKGLILVGIPLMFQLAFIAFFTYRWHQTELLASQEAQSRKIISSASLLTRLTMESALTAVQVIVGPENGPPRGELRRRYQSNFARVTQELANLKQLTPEEFSQGGNLSTIESGIHHAFGILEELQLSPYPRGVRVSSMEYALALIKALPPLETVADALRRLDEEETSRFSITRQNRKQAEQLLSTTLTTAITINILIAIGTALYFSRNISQRIRTIIDNTTQLSKEIPQLKSIPGDDEISELDRAIHLTAEELHTLRQQKMAAIRSTTSELNGPLSSASQLLDRLLSEESGSLSPLARERIQMAQSGLQQSRRLTTELLDLEKMETGKFHIACQQSDISSVIELVRPQVTGLADSYRIKLDLPDVQRRLPMDSDRIVQVLVNLISNAIRHSPASGTVKVEVETNINSLEVRVLDNGPGIAPEVRRQIFEPFEQLQNVEKAGTRKHSGAGLGLAICKAIIEGHNGTIGVRPNVDTGSIFWFRLPADNAEESKLKNG